MGLVTLTFNGRFQGLGDRKDVSEKDVESGVTQMANAVGYLASASTTIAIGLLSNIHGLYLHFTSAQSAVNSGLWVYQSGQTFTSGLHLTQDQWVMLRPYNKTEQFHVFMNSSAGGATFEYNMFGV